MAGKLVVAAGRIEDQIVAIGRKLVHQRVQFGNRAAAKHLAARDGQIQPAAPDRFGAVFQIAMRGALARIEINGRNRAPR
jgi:hypothetical protein